MGRLSGVIGKLFSFVRVIRNEAKLSDVKIDVGGGDILTAEYTHPSGDDSFPLPDDYVSAVRIPRSGRILILGFVESDAQQKALKGDKRIYARNENREEMIELWLKSDGTATLNNANGSFTLSPDGKFVTTNPNGTYTLNADGSHKGENANGNFQLLANGTMDINTATIDPGGNIIATSVSAPSIKVNGKELDGHDHEIEDGSSAPGPTGPNN